MTLFCLNKLITLKNESESRSVMSGSLRPRGLHMGWHSVLQGILPTQGSNPGLPHCGQILYQLRHQGSPRILKWVTFPFSSGSSQPRNPTGVSCIAGRFFTNWAKGTEPATDRGKVLCLVWITPEASCCFWAGLPLVAHIHRPCPFTWRSLSKPALWSLVFPFRPHLICTLMD